MEISEIKGVVMAILTALGGFFLPIIDFIVAILVLLGINFLSGWIEDELHGEGWRWKKAFKTFYECLVMCGIGAFIFVIGHFMHREDAAILHRFVNFLHFIISMQFVEKIPYLKAFLMQEKNERMKDFNDNGENVNKKNEKYE